MASLQKLTIFVMVVTVAMSVDVVQGLTPLSDFHTGIATFFGGAPDGMDPSSPSYGTKEGSCGFGEISKSSFPFFSTAAFSPSNSFFQEGPMNACGQCIEIQCTGDRCKKDIQGNTYAIITQITDKCPECSADHIDVQATAWAKLADPALGKIDIKYRRVECEVVDDMKVSVSNFRNNGGWISLTVEDVAARGAIKQVYVKSSSGGDWVALQNTYGATWESSSAPSAPLDFKFLDDAGAEVEASAVVDSAGITSKVFTTGHQFESKNGGPVQSFEGKDPMLVTVKAEDGNKGGRRMLLQA